MSFQQPLELLLIYTRHNRYPQKWGTSSSYGKAPTTWRNDWRVVYYAMLFSCIFVLVSTVPSLRYSRLTFRSDAHSELLNSHKDITVNSELPNGTFTLLILYPSLSLSLPGRLFGHQITSAMVEARFIPRLELILMGRTQVIWPCGRCPRKFDYGVWSV